VIACSLCGCAQWRNATSSQQWIELPPPPGATTDVLRAEWSLVQQGTPVTNAAQIADLAARGVVKAWGPADIERGFAWEPDGRVELSVKTRNSDWLGGLFRGLWTTGSTLFEGLLTAAAGAAP
jgi:hypothetical protein